MSLNHNMLSKKKHILLNILHGYLIANTLFIFFQGTTHNATLLPIPWTEARYGSTSWYCYHSKHWKNLTTGVTLFWPWFTKNGKAVCICLYRYTYFLMINNTLVGICTQIYENRWLSGRLLVLDAYWTMGSRMIGRNLQNHTFLLNSPCGNHVPSGESLSSTSVPFKFLPYRGLIFSMHEQLSRV